MKHKGSQFFAYVLVAAFAIIAMRALIHSGFWTSHDGWHQVARLYHFNEALRSGQIPPRYSFRLFNGFGYPLFTFSYHLPWLMAEPFLLVGFSIFDAIKAVFIIGYILSGIFMLRWLKEMWGVRAGVVGSLLYLWAPYRFSDIYVRAALGEATSFIFIPVFFHGLYRICNNINRTGIVLCAIGLAGIILSHMMILPMILVAGALFVLFNLRTGKPMFIIKNVLFGLGLGIMVAFYYILPALVYKKITIFQDVQTMFFQKQLLTLKELFYMPWGYSAAFSGVGQMSLQVGIAQWAVFITFCITLLKKLSLHSKYKSNSNWVNGIVFGVIFILSVFLSSTLSAGLWDSIRQVLPLDFPWRLLVLATFASAVLGGFVITVLTHRQQLIISIGMIALCVYANRNHLRVNQYTDIPLSLYIASERSTNTYDEYLPRYAKIEVVSQENRQPVEDHGVTISDLSETVSQISFTTDTSKPTQIRIRSVYFPGMKLLIDGKTTTFSYSDGGFIDFDIYTGRHRVKLVYRETPLNILADVVSLIGIIIIFSLSRNFRLFKRTI